MESRSVGVRFSSVDRWEDFPVAFTRAMGAVALEQAELIHGGVAGSLGAWRPLRPMFLDRDHYTEVGRISARLMRLALDACRRRAATAGELCAALGVPADDVKLLVRDEPLDDGLLVAARPDIVYQCGVPCFVEFNIDGALGGTLQVDLLAERFLDVCRSVADGENIHRPVSAVDARFAAIRASLRLPEGSRLAIPVFRNGAAPGLEDPQAFLAWLEPMCESGRRHGLDTVACLMDQLTAEAEDSTLMLDGRRVDAVFRLFLSFDQPSGTGLDALVRAVRARRVAMHTSEATWLLSDKTILAWLWQDRRLLPVPDRDLIERHIPWTALFPGEDDGQDVPSKLLERQSELVLKPVGGYGGSGVVLGPEVSRDEWHSALINARAEGRHILQRHVVPDRLKLDFVDLSTGAVESADVPFVLGPFLFDGEPSGVLVRHGVPGGGPVLNAHHGAVMSTALVVE